jgi:iron complex outermembrane receptor protein
MKQSKLATAIKFAMGATAALTVLPAANTFADESTLEEVVVTGSFIKRAPIDGASPVSTITADDIKIEGDFSVADSLRSSALNSFGSFSERSGSSAQSQATINLRGAGSNRTLVLLDGKRLPGSPTMGGQSANLNAIPMAAIDRIEVLTDGASSTYGSDAIAGVVNIIPKKDFEGVEISGGIGYRDRDTGLTSKEFSIVAGTSSDKGNITIAFDHQSREGISDAARDFTAAKAVDLNGDGDFDAYTAEMDGWSIYGATVAAPDFSTATASPLCDSLISEYGNDVFLKADASEDWGTPGATYCMYAYANVSYNRASVDRNTLYVNSDYAVSDEVEWFGRAMFVQNSSFGRYAPPAAPWRNMAADNPHNPYGEETTGYFRWVGIGTRDGNIDDYNIDLLTGLRGTGDLNWEVYYHRNKTDNKSVGQYYLSYGGLAYNQANDIDLGSEAGIANMKATTLQESDSTFDQFFAGFGFEAGELGGGSISHYVGSEYMEVTYGDVYDGQSEAGLVGGSAGNTSAGERDITALFYEALLPVTDDLEVNVAVRYDDYSDFGSNTAPKVSARYQLTDDVVLRASYSEAFRAPGLDELNAKTTFSAEGAIDYAQGKTTAQQYDTYYTSNSNLGPETSEYTNLGIVWNATDDTTVTLDYFDLQIDNVIRTKSLQSLLSDEQAGLITALAPDADTTGQTFYLKRAATGVLLEAGTGYNNGEGFNIEGIDLNITTGFDTEIGEFGVRWNNSFVLGYEQELGGAVVDTAGWSGQPDYRSVLTLSFMRGDHFVALNSSYIASTTEFESQGASGWETSGQLDSWLTHNLTYSYDMGEYGKVTATINNLTDEDPVLSSAGTWDNYDLYDNFGRDYRLNYSYSF